MMTLNEIRKLRGMTLSEFSRKSGLSPHTARNLMGYRELYGNCLLYTSFSAASKKSGTSAMTAGQMTRPSGGR